MPLRFTIRCLLAAAVYVAIAAMAFRREWWIWADLLWGLAWLAFAYALLNAWLRDGTARAGAVGFALLMACYGLSVQFVPTNLPTERILWAIGVDATSAASPASPVNFYAYQPMFSSPPFYTPGGIKVGAADTPFFIQYTATLRAAHSVAAVVAGLAGYGLGLWVWSQARPRTSAVASPTNP